MHGHLNVKSSRFSKDICPNFFQSEYNIRFFVPVGHYNPYTIEQLAHLFT